MYYISKLNQMNGDTAFSLFPHTFLFHYSHRDRFMPKLHHLFTMTQHSDLSQPPPPSASAPEVQALVTFTPPRYKEPPLSQTEEEEEKNEEEQSVQDRIEAMHFNNPSYFLLQAEYNM